MHFKNTIILLFSLMGNCELNAQIKGRYYSGDTSINLFKNGRFTYSISNTDNYPNDLSSFYSGNYVIENNLLALYSESDSLTIYASRFEVKCTNSSSSLVQLTISLLDTKTQSLPGAAITLKKTNGLMVGNYTINIRSEKKIAFPKTNDTLIATIKFFNEDPYTFLVLPNHDYTVQKIVIPVKYSIKPPTLTFLIKKKGKHIFLNHTVLKKRRNKKDYQNKQKQKKHFFYGCYIIPHKWYKGGTFYRFDEGNERE